MAGAHRRGRRTNVLVIRTKSGIEVRVPLDEIDTVVELEGSSGSEKPVPPHAYVHREGVNRCLACWKERSHPAHTDVAVHER
jgi:hypothetical protein